MGISRKLLGSDAKLEILALFHKNPELVDRMEGVSRRIGRELSEVEADMRDLVDIGVLHAGKAESANVIYYDQKNHAEIQRQISYQLRKGT